MLQDEGTSKVKEIIEEDIWGTVKDFLNLGIHLGEGENSIHVTIGLLIAVIIAFFITSLFLRWLRSVLTRKMEGEDRLKFFTVFKFVKYLTYLAVILATLSAAGIDVTLLLTASAVLFVGLGLALQELFQDIIAGIFIILDKTLQVGDVVEVEGKVGKIFEIKLRSSRAITRDDKVIIIPNHKFLSDLVYNFTQNHKMTREEVVVGVAYGSDTQLVTRLMLESVQEQREILKNPKPFVLFQDFGDSALIFSVKFFIPDSFSEPRIASAVRFAIDKKFRENGVVIPFPQRDVHLYQNEPLRHQQLPNPEKS